MHRGLQGCEAVQGRGWTVMGEKGGAGHHLAPSASEALLSAAIPLPFSRPFQIQRGPRAASVLKIATTHGVA